MRQTKTSHLIFSSILGLLSATAHGGNQVTVSLSGSIPTIQEISISSATLTNPTMNINVGSASQTYSLDFNPATLGYATNAVSPTRITAALATAPAKGSVVLSVSGLVTQGLLAGSSAGTPANGQLNLARVGQTVTLIDKISNVNTSAALSFGFSLDMNQAPGALTASVLLTMTASS